MYQGTITSHGDMMARICAESEQAVRHTMNQHVDYLISTGQVAVTNKHHKGVTTTTAPIDCDACPLVATCKPK